MKLLIILILMLGMGAGAWHSYEKRNLLIQAALLSEGFALSESVKSRVSDYFVQQSVMPHDNADAELPPAKTIYGTSVKRVAVNRSGVVMVDFDDEIGAQSMIFTPSVSPVSGLLEWRCTSDSLPREVLELLRPRCDYIAATNEGQLMHAIANADIHRVEQLLEAGANPNAVVNGNTPLMLAAKTGDVAAAKLLIDKGASVDNNALNSERRTPLMVAISSDNADVVGLLLGKGASVTRRDYKGMTAREHANNTDRRLGGERYELMVMARFNPNFAGQPKSTQKKQRTSAELAAHLDALYVQLDQATKDCHAQRIATLLQEEDDFDSTELIDGEPLVKWIKKPVCQSKLTAFVKTKDTYIKALDARFSAASAACDRKNIQTMLQTNPDFDVMTSMQLHSHFDRAISGGCSNIISMFIRDKKLTNQLDGSVLITAIRTAPQNRQVEMIGTLIAAGADVNYHDKYGETPLAAAISLEQPVVAKYLVDAGADVNAPTSNDSYPLIEAAKKGFNHLASQLIRQGADINQQDGLGRTALIAAVAKGRRKLVDTLLRAGANAMHRDNDGISAVMLAESRNFRQIYAQLTASASNTAH